MVVSLVSLKLRLDNVGGAGAEGVEVSMMIFRDWQLKLLARWSGWSVGWGESLNC